jgi:hypothetical protein
MLLNHDLGLIDSIQSLDVTTVPSAGGVAGQLQIIGNAGLVVPAGTTAQRPAVAINGTTRYNTTLNVTEFYQNGSWVNFSGGSVTSVAVAGSTGISSAGGPITSTGTITLTLSTELQGLSALSANGIIARTTAGTYASRTVTGTASNIVVTNGDGIAGNPTINLATIGTPVTSFFGQFSTDTFGRVSSTAAANASNITTALGFTPVNKAGDTMTGALNMGGNLISNVAAPVSGADAATKNYVDAATTGLSWKQATQCATTANITLSGLQTLDTYTTIAGDRVLVKNQTTPSQNGIYIAAVGSWTRAADMNLSAEFPNATVYVSQGATLRDTGWTQINDGITVDTSAVSFIQFSGSGTYTAGTGLTLSGNTFSISSPIPTTLGGTGLTTTGTASQILGVNVGGTALEYKTITGGTGVTITPSANTITIANSGVTSIVAGTGVSISGSTGAVTVNNTGVTSVNATTSSAGLTIGGGPITTTGTLTFTLGNDLQTLSGFNTGTGIAVRTAAGAWSLRSLTGTANQIVITNSDGVTASPTFSLASNAVLPGTGAVTLPSGTSAQQPVAAAGLTRYDTTAGRMTWSDGTSWFNVGKGDGSVTSVGLSLPGIFSVSGSPVTNTGNLSASFVSQSANTVFAAPSGSFGAPTFRALTAADLPIVLYRESSSGLTAPTVTALGAQGFGDSANASLYGQKAFSSDAFAAAGDAQHSIYISRNTSSTAANTELFLDNGIARLVPANNSVWTFDVMIAGRRTDAVGGAAGYKITGVIRKDTTNGSIAFVGVPSKQVLGETTAALNATVVADTVNGSLNIVVNGLAGQTWRWVATTQATEVTN